LILLVWSAGKESGWCLIAFIARVVDSVFHLPGEHSNEVS